jgi:hypothetical protein
MLLVNSLPMIASEAVAKGSKLHETLGWPEETAIRQTLKSRET